MTHPSHIARVIAERDELAGRKGKLFDFFDTDLFAGLDSAEQEDMKRQAHVMSEYEVVLNSRLNRAGVTTLDSGGGGTTNPTQPGKPPKIDG